MIHFPIKMPGLLLKLFFSLMVIFSLVMFSLVGCGTGSDACDDVKSSCRDRGGTPINCTGSSSLFSSECECTCSGV